MFSFHKVIDHIALTKQGDNSFGCVVPSVCLFVSVQSRSKFGFKVKDQAKVMGQGQRSDFLLTVIGIRGSAFPVADDLIDRL